MVDFYSIDMASDRYRSPELPSRAPASDRHSQPCPPPSLALPSRPLPELPNDCPEDIGVIYEEVGRDESHREMPPTPVPRYENTKEPSDGVGDLYGRKDFYGEPNKEDLYGTFPEEDFSGQPDNYYWSIGIDVQQAENLYMSISEIEEQHKLTEIKELNKEAKEETTNEMNEEVKEETREPVKNCHEEMKEDEEVKMKEEEEELKDKEEPETTLEEDICTFIKNEYTFKSTIWRIREAKVYLTRDLQHLLAGIETLTNINNDMYDELNQGTRSCSRIAQVFLSRNNQLEMYKFYLLNAPKIHKLIQGQPREVKLKFPNLETDIQSSWLRLHFYLTSLQKMTVVAPPEEKADLQMVVDRLRDLNRQGDSGILIDGVRGAPKGLLDPNHLLLHSLFQIKNNYLQNHKVYRVLLFPETMVLTVPTDDGYDYLSHLPVARLKVLRAESDPTRCLELKVDSEKYVLRAASRELQQLWKRRLQLLTEGQTNPEGHDHVSQ